MEAFQVDRGHPNAAETLIVGSRGAPSSHVVSPIFAILLGFQIRQEVEPEDSAQS